MEQKRTQRLQGIQALRIIAALLVVIIHSTFYVFERMDKKFPVWSPGARGVDLFFVISGFVMVFSSQRLAGLSDGWKTFAAHRLLRIVPLYWLITTLKILIVALTVGLARHTVLNPHTVISSYLFLPAKNLDGKIEPLVGVGWTLNFEMLFYFLFTSALFLRANVYKFVGIILAVLSIGQFFRPTDWPPMAFYFNSIVLEFFLGMLVARACLRGTRIAARFVLPLLTVGFLLLLCTPDSYWGLPKVIVNGMPAALIVWSVVSFPALDRWIPHWIGYLGDASYSIYLVHPFVCPFPPAILRHWHMDLPWLSIGMSIVLGLGAGCICHQFIERPLTRSLKSFFATRRLLTWSPAASAIRVTDRRWDSWLSAKFHRRHGVRGEDMSRDVFTIQK
jgi:exopolysaccharide production protein ExoZ